MPSPIIILSCHNFHREIAAAIREEGWPDVLAAEFPSRCGRPPVTWSELKAILPAAAGGLLVLGNACLKDLGEVPSDFPPTKVVPLGQCFNLVANSRLVADAIADGAYLMTPTWAVDWRRNIAELGFSADMAGEFFRDFATKLVLLDTGIDPDCRRHFAEMKKATGLPGRRVTVGLAPTRATLGRHLLDWHIARRRQSADSDRRHAGELADHVSAMDMLARLVGTQQETDTIATIVDLFRMLFAPEAVHYLRIDREVALPEGAIPSDVLASLTSLHDEYAVTADGNGFLLRIGRPGERLGCVAVSGLSFPESRERYLNMALAMSGVCALAIENARNRRKLMDAERLSSLGIVVAGVAHEINTPLGICRVAASSLGRNVDDLAQRFAERTMTRDDLQSGLDTVRQASGMLMSHLERITQLVGAFRQLAVDGRTPEKRCFLMKTCIDEVAASLAEKLATVALTISCDPQLQLEGVPGDWASIFLNLLGNSLKHGFKGRQSGAVTIDVSEDKGRLRVVYSDDGVGMEPAVLSQIFTPFFTTDLQTGTGLGMYLVFNLVVHRFGGDITCQSAPGQGVCFRMELPL